MCVCVCVCDKYYLPPLGDWSSKVSVVVVGAVECAVVYPARNINIHHFISTNREFFWNIFFSSESCIQLGNGQIYQIITKLKCMLKTIIKIIFKTYYNFIFFKHPQKTQEIEVKKER